MCGIDLYVLSTAQADCKCLETFSALSDHDNTANVQRRGPDSFRQVHISDESHKVLLGASVLQMRSELIPQPIAIKSEHQSSYLAWNGEVYQALLPNAGTSDGSVLKDVWDYGQSDTELVAAMLQQQHQQSMESVCDTLGRLVNAEFALVIASDQGIYFARDSFGRRSLLRSDCPICNSFRITSVIPTLPTEESQSSSWIEIPPGKVFGYHFQTGWQVMDFHATEHHNVSTLLSPTTSLTAPDGASEELWKASFQFEDLLRRAVLSRLDHSDSRPTTVLFSGGIDSVVLARLAIEMSENKPVILSNVSFGDDFQKSADRKAALVSYQELLDMFPNRTILYDDIIISWEETLQQETRIRTLLHPKVTTMDLNIATALWFACKGTDRVQGNLDSRVLLLGMGADEQLGGYGRHRKAFEKGGSQHLHDELQMDQDRLWERNLGRDDRVSADHGKEARFPYLDTSVVNFLRATPKDIICDFTLPPGEGDKRILRILALRLGLKHSSGLVKRAIQFGSRISHVSDTKRFGSRRKAKGDKQSPKMPSN